MSSSWARHCVRRRLRGINFFMHGEWGAGKTTILHKLKLGEVVTTAPTLGQWKVETVEHKDIKFTSWDPEGSDAVRPLWGHFYQNVHALIFVIDSSDRDVVDEAHDTLHRLLMEFGRKSFCDRNRCPQLLTAPVLIFANKQDLPGAMSTSFITERLGLHSIRKRKWSIQACCATTGDGLYDGLEWVVAAIGHNRSQDEHVCEMAWSETRHWACLCQRLCWRLCQRLCRRVT